MTMRSDFPDEEFAGHSYKAEVLPDGKLHWHDGDVWERCVGRLDGDGAVCFDCPNTAQSGTLEDGTQYTACIERVVPATDFHLRAISVQ